MLSHYVKAVRRSKSHTTLAHPRKAGSAHSTRAHPDFEYIPSASPLSKAYSINHLPTAQGDSPAVAKPRFGRRGSVHSLLGMEGFWYNLCCLVNG